jgi:hypothetical protein
MNPAIHPPRAIPKKLKMALAIAAPTMPSMIFISNRILFAALGNDGKHANILRALAWLFKAGAA